MGVAGQARVVTDKNKFLVRIAGVTHTGWVKSSEVKHTDEVIEYIEGGDSTPTKDAGNRKYEPVTLERGVVADDSDIYDWTQLVTDAAANTGVVADEYKKTVDLVSVQRDGTELIERLHFAWPGERSGGDRDATGNEKAMESVVLNFKYATRLRA